VNIRGKLPGSALLAIAAGLAIAFPSAAEAGLSTGVLSVTASVSPSVVLKYESAPTPLHVTEGDIARGYIDVAGADRLTIDADRTMEPLAKITVDYEPDPYSFTSIQVASQTLQPGAAGSQRMVALANYVNELSATAAGPAAEPRSATRGGASVNTFNAAHSVSDRASVTSLDYRLMLPKGIKPGNISATLTLSLQL
jgi:hypothetical protein